MSRYIDADKLKEKLMCTDIYYEDKTRTYHQFYKAEDVDAQPAADVRENVKGEWIRRKDTIQCSQCKAKWIDHTYLIETFRFCPNCGADMRGGNNG